MSPFLAGKLLRKGARNAPRHPGLDRAETKGRFHNLDIDMS